jgi:predicted RNA methylase
MITGTPLGVSLRVFVLLGLLAPPVSAQLGSRPAAEWATVLESGRRLASLDIENVVARMSLEPGDVVADIGAGTGIFSVPIARAVGPTGTVYAVEVDGGFLPIIESKAREAGLSNVRTVLGEFGDPKLPVRNIEVAFFHDVLHHIQDRAAYLRALAGYMAPASRIVVVDYDRSHPATPHQNEPEMLISQDEVTAWMAAAGFRPVQEFELFEEKFFVVYGRN